MVRLQENEEVDKGKKSWSDLPEGIPSLIQSRLFLGDYNAFNAVCKSWRSTYNPVRPLPPPINCPFRSSPCLMFIDKMNDMTTFFHPMYNDFYAMDIPELYGARIYSSRYGWLLACVGFKIFFFNPFTREKIELTDMPVRHGFGYTCFTSPPTSQDCLVIGLWCLRGSMLIGILRRGQQSWDNYYYSNNEEFMCSGCNPILFNGLFYVLGAAGNIGVFDPENPSWEVFGKPYEFDQKFFHRCFFSELDGNFVVACLSRDPDKYQEVHFLSFDLTNMVWQQQQNIGDEMFYASCGSSFFKRAVVNRMSNKIYFPIFSGKNGVFYSLATKSFHSFAGVGDDSSTKKKIMRPMHNAWMEPNFESVSHGKLTWC